MESKLPSLKAYAGTRWKVHREYANNIKPQYHGGLV